MVQDNPEINKRIAEMTALGRAGGLPDDIGPTIASLLSNGNRFGRPTLEVSMALRAHRMRHFSRSIEVAFHS